MIKEAARVNGSVISRFEVDSLAGSLAVELHRRSLRQLSEEVQAEIEQMALDKLIARELIYLAALQEGVVASQADVDRELEKALKDYRDERDFIKALERGGIDVLTYQRLLRKDATVNLMNKRLQADVAEPDEKQVRAFYDSHRRQLVRPAKVRASHILVPIEDGQRRQALERIEEIKKRCATEEFATVASLHSCCPSASNGGDLGFFRRRDMAESFAEAAFSQPVGVVGDVVESDFGLHLIKVTERQEEAPLDFDEARDQIREFLRQQDSAQSLQRWVEELKAGATIVIAPH